jgi:hypothetical protein
MNLITGIKGSPTQGSVSGKQRHTRNALVVSETALSLMLLVGAALLA